MEIEIKLPWPDWQVTKLLGSGGYGRVYEIHRDRYGISEAAAVKVLSFPKDEDEISEGLRSGYVEETLAAEYRQQVESVLKEYRLLKELGDDPHIVRCDDYAAVPHSNGIGWNVYLKMELLTPLKQYLGKNAIPPEQVVQLGSDICQALAACWAKRILHRDIKPDNILVSGKGVFKLSDFGEAKLVEKTMASGVAGTWSFIAPEVGNHSRYGEPADIYSLGMVLYLMLNRCMLPFLPRPWGLCSTAEQDQARQRRLSGEPLPPPADGSPALKKVVLKACAFRPEDRYATPDELREALWAALRGEAPADNPPRQSAERSMHTMPDEDSPSGNWAADSRWSGEPSSMRDERSEGTMGCSWAAPSFEWGESSMPADSDLEETMPSDSGPVGQEGSQPAKGNDLYREVSITPEQAEAGCQVTVEGYKGAKLKVTIPANSPNGKQLRCRGRGYPSFNGGENGDLYVTVQIGTGRYAVPAELPKRKTSFKDILIVLAILAAIAGGMFIIHQASKEAVSFEANNLELNGQVNQAAVFLEDSMYIHKSNGDYLRTGGSWKVEKTKDEFNDDYGWREIEIRVTLTPSEPLESGDALLDCGGLYDYYSGRWMDIGDDNYSYILKWNGHKVFLFASCYKYWADGSLIKEYSIDASDYGSIQYDGLIFAVEQMPGQQELSELENIKDGTNIMDISVIDPYSSTYFPLMSDHPGAWK